MVVDTATTKALLWSKRVVVALLSLILTSCRAPAVWHTDTAGGGVARLTIPIEDPFRGIQVELLKLGNGERRLYLNVFSIPLTEGGDDEVPVVLSWEGCHLEVVVPIMAGGQRLLLPDPIANDLIAALESGSSVEIRLGRYYSKLSPDGFVEAYRSFKRPF